MPKDKFQQNNPSNILPQEKHHPIRKRQHIKKDHKKKDKRKSQVPITPPQQIPQPNQQQNEEFPNTFNSFQSEASKYQRLDEFWKVDIESLYRKEFTEEDKSYLTSVINEPKPSIIDVFKNDELNLWKQKISLEQLYKYVSLIMEFTGNDDYTFVALQSQNKKQHYVLTLDQNKRIEKAVQVSEQEMSLLAFRQQCIQIIKKKKDYYNMVLSKNQKLSQVSLELTFLVNYINVIKNKLDQKLQQLDQRAKQQPKNQPPAKVQENYITFLIKKNLKKALNDQQIDFFNHFKKLDVNEHVSGLIDSKPITEKKDFQEYIRKRKLKKTGKKARWVLKTACGGCLSYHYELYNPFSFCSECHTRYHKYCYIPKNQGICQSCFLSKNNQTKKSRINECQLCGTKGFLYLPMNQSNNAHIFCMLINGLWKFQNTQIVFQKKHIQNAVENVCCSICKQSNSCIYKCDRCSNHAHPLCAYLNGWRIKQQISKKSSNQIVKLQCCHGVDKEKNEKRRRFVLNYKRCVFSQCE